MTDADGFLLLGNADVGKTTLLTQIHGRLQAGTGRLSMRSAPESLAPIQAALRRLEQGLAIEHTPHTTNVEQILHAIDDIGHPIDIVLPDYAGETLADVVASRRIPAAWRERVCTTGRWILLLRLSQHPPLPDVLNRPVANTETDGTPERTAQESLELPLDLWSVELLQILMHARRASHSRRSFPRLTLVLSCWDELNIPHGTAPSQVLTERAPLVADYCAAHWAAAMLSIVGLSAQGRALHKDQEATDFVDSGPQQMGWLVTPEGEHDGDLTRLLTDL